jgi:hypothetical protein
MPSSADDERRRLVPLGQMVDGRPHRARGGERERSACTAARGGERSAAPAAGSTGR